MENKRRVRSWFIGVVISLAALILAFWGVKPGRVLEILLDIRVVYLMPAVLLVILGLLARARSWHILLGTAVPFRRAFEALNEGYLLNTLLPLRIGEIARAFLVSRGQTVGFGLAFSTVIVERLIDSIIALAGLVTTLPFVLDIQWAREIAWSIAAILLVGSAILVFLASNEQRLLGLLGRLPSSRLDRVIRMTEDFINGLGIVLRPRRLIAAAFWSLIAWVTTWIQLALLMDAVGIESELFFFPFIAGVTAFGAAVPSLPGAIGVFELSASWAMMALDVARANALSVAILWHVLQVIITSLIGGWAFAKEGQTVIQFANRVQKVVAESPDETMP
jgi:uncharacterized protein (TIRG00374 family)